MRVCQGLAVEKAVFSKWEKQAKSIHQVEAGGTQESMAWNDSPPQRGDSLLDSPSLWDLGKSLLNIQRKRGHASWVDIRGESEIKQTPDIFSVMGVFFP